MIRVKSKAFCSKIDTTHFTVSRNLSYTYKNEGNDRFKIIKENALLNEAGAKKFYDTLLQFYTPESEMYISLTCGMRLWVFPSLFWTTGSPVQNKNTSNTVSATEKKNNIDQ